MHGKNGRHNVATKTYEQGSYANGKPLSCGKHLNAWTTIDMCLRLPQQRLSARTVIRKLSRRSSLKHRQASKRREREKARWTHCKASLHRVTRLTKIEIRVPSDLLWGVKARATGQLLDVVMQLPPSRGDPRIAHREAGGDCIPPVHPKEDLYPLYVLRALSCEESKEDRDAPQGVLSDADFGLLSTERAVAELQVLGLPLQHQDEALSTGETLFLRPMYKK